MGIGIAPVDACPWHGNASEGSNKAAKQIEAVARMQLEETFLD
jgi:hypothetical protein